MTPLAAYLVLFVAVGTGFIFVHLVAGKLIRPSTPSAEKGTIYECGEPTIGSAWIQFDLRFYVVALLFVIFDVEVAFFFPWAEVFGKANAIANAPDPRTAAQYNDFGDKVLDLAIPSDSPVGEGNLLRWKKMKSLTERELSAFEKLGPAQQTMLRSMNKEQIKGLLELTSEQRQVVNKSLGELQSTFTAQAKEREEPLQAFIDSGVEKDRAALRDLVKWSKTADKGYLETTTLGNLAAGRITILQAFQAPRMGPANPLLVRAEKNNPQTLAALRDLSTRQIQQLQQQAGAILATLKQIGPDQMAFWNVLTLRFLKDVDSMSDEQVAVLPDLTREGILTLSDSVAAQTKEQARTIAWLALGEILVFFGVLLVGFAYLWKRGDLAWVRSTTAMETVDRVETEQAALIPEAAHTLQHAGAGDPAGH